MPAAPGGSANPFAPLPPKGIAPLNITLSFDRVTCAAHSDTLLSREPENPGNLAHPSMILAPQNRAPIPFAA